MSTEGSLTAAETLLRGLGADAFELACEGSDQQILRFANNRITQATARSDRILRARVWAGGGVAVVRTNAAPGSDRLRAELESCLARARAGAEAGFREAPPEIAGGEARAGAEDLRDPELLARLDEPGALVEAFAGVFERAADGGTELAGRFDVGVRDFSVCNGHGLFRSFSVTEAEARLIAVDRHDDHISGHAAGVGAGPGATRLMPLAERAIEKCARSRRRVDLPPGDYDVILEPEAVAELLEWLAGIAFTAQSLEERRSFLRGRFGEQVLGPEVTLVDDGRSPHGLGIPRPFDAEGVPKREVLIIDRGVARGVVWDRATARRAGCASTGHARFGEATEEHGPVASHLAMAGGAETEQELVEKVERGLWVTRFHYVNGLLDPPRGVMTGLTRDGTFLIEDGRLGPGVGMLRFTDSIVEALQRVGGLSAGRRAVRTGWFDPGTYICPTVLIRGLHFSGDTRG